MSSLKNMNLFEVCNGFFARVHHSKDTTNRNRFKLRYIKDDIGVFYFKPRGDILKHVFGRGKDYLFTDFQGGENPYMLKYEEHKEGVEVGGPKVIWDIKNNFYQYVIPTRVDHCGCSLEMAGMFNVYYSHKIPIKKTPEYLELVNKIIKN